jgi:hypothetical protein
MADNGNSAPIIAGGSQPERLESVFDIVSRIQKFSAGGKGGGIVPDTFLSMKERWDIWMIGYKKTLTSGLVTAALTPLLIGVVERVIPVFGDAEPTLIDQLLAFALTVGFPLGYASVVYHLGQYYTDDYSKAMIKQFISGVLWGAITKIAMVFLGFHAIALLLMTDRNLAKFILFFDGVFSAAKLNRAFAFLVEMKSVLLTSAWFVLLITVVIQIMIPRVSIYVQIWRERGGKGVDGFPV